MTESTMSEAKVTTDHNEIRAWAEKRGGTPSTVEGTGDKGGVGVLRLDFPPKNTELEKISWEEFFKKFEKEKLAFLYQDKTSDGAESRFHKFVNRGSKQ
jgi:hypothetical protein